MNGLRLEQCGDLLTIAEYSEWARQTIKTTYNQIHRGACLVPPFALKPTVRWRRADLEQKLEQRDLAASQRKTRMLQRRMRVVRSA